MDEATTAAVGVIAAIAGGLITGVFTYRAAQRQADAAWNGAQRRADAAFAAAQRQADAQLDVMRETFREQAAGVRRAVRRAAYVAFLGRVDQARHAQRAWADSPLVATREAWHTASRAVDEPLTVVRLAGPATVAAAAGALAAALAPAAGRLPTPAE
ncbi:hypothetical protein [Embleya sp. NPDC001921]